MHSKLPPSVVLSQVYQVLNPPPVQPLSWRTPLRPAVRLIRTLPDVLAFVRQYGPAVAETHKVSVVKQAAQLLRQIHSGFSGDDFYRFRMYLSSSEHASLFVPLKSNIRIRSALYRMLDLDADALADKRRFGRSAGARNLPAPSTVADFADGKVKWWSQNGLPAADLFVKEAASMCGAGAMVFRWDGGRSWEGMGRMFDGDALVAYLAEQSMQAPLLLQRRLANHPALVDLGPQGLCTVRLVTFRRPVSTNAEVLLAAFRMPQGEDVADNFARGGLACPIDLGTGRLGAAVYKDLGLAHLDVEQHPHTGGAISGRQLPYWQEVIELGLRAHQAFPEYPSVGWDIAITSEGPVLLEANYNWDVVLAQQAGCRPLGATKWSEHHVEWADWALSRKKCAASAAASISPAHS
jgi:hypothetical protein